MTEPVIGRVAAARTFLGQIWKLAAPYWWSEEKWVARGLLAVILSMNVFLVWLSKQLNDWNRQFFDALQDKNGEAFWKLLISFASPSELFFSFAGLVFVFIVIAVYRQWLRQYLSIRWRRWLTHVYFKEWLGERSYYRMELTNAGTDNPEQRIEQDIKEFTEGTPVLVFGLISEIMTLITFTYVLWGLSGSLSLGFLGGVEIPGYMVWVALLYSIAGSYATYWVGRRLVQINFDLQRFNADLRYRLIRVRENAESIALYHGEPDESRRLSGAFGRIYDMFWEYMRLNKRLTWLGVFYAQVAGIFPIVVQAPRYFAGEITLGVLTQTAGAFAQVQGSLSWFVDSFTSLADWKAGVDRLTTFANAIAASKQRAEAERNLDMAEADSQELSLRDVTVALPSGRSLIENVDLTLAPGERLVIQGPSGSGKTTLFRMLAGLWSYGSGRIRLPRGGRALFLPQKPYLPIGSLRDSLCYPAKADAHPDAEIKAVLQSCQLDHLLERLDEVANWSLVLSPGEQQRLSFARALLIRPEWLFLDEATSALDEATETRLYRLIEEHLPSATVVSIAHKPSVLRFHQRRLLIDPKERRASLGELAPAE